MTREEIESLLNTNEDALFEQLGRRTTPGSAPTLTNQEYAKNGKSWFGQRKPEIARIICTNPVLSALSKDGYELVLTIAPLIAPLIHTPLVALTVAALVVKIGFNGFCKAQGYGEE